MKIEIEFQEVERLRDEVRTQAGTIIQLKEELKSLDKKEIENKAVYLSMELFVEYMNLTFEKLGFKGDSMGFDKAVIFPENVNHWLGKQWYKKRDEIKVTLNAFITEEYRKAFLNMGIITKDEKWNSLTNS